MTIHTQDSGENSCRRDTDVYEAITGVCGTYPRSCIRNSGKSDRKHGTHHRVRYAQEGEDRITVDVEFFKRGQFVGNVFNASITNTYSNEPVILKWPRMEHLHVCDCNHTRLSVRIAEICARVILAFAKESKTDRWTLSCNLPVITHFYDSDTCHEILSECVIPEYVKFNSNSGWFLDDSSTPNLIVQALSHFSYVWSQGNMVICNLQGGIDKKQRKILLSHPMIITPKGGAFGCGDSGTQGMFKFMKSHLCNRFCNHMPLNLPNDV